MNKANNTADANGLSETNNIQYPELDVTKLGEANNSEKEAKICESHLF